MRRDADRGASSRWWGCVSAEEEAGVATWGRVWRVTRAAGGGASAQRTWVKFGGCTVACGGATCARERFFSNMGVVWGFDAFSRYVMRCLFPNNSN